MTLFVFKPLHVPKEYANLPFDTLMVKLANRRANLSVGQQQKLEALLQHHNIHIEQNVSAKAGDALSPDSHLVDGLRETSDPKQHGKVAHLIPGYTVPGKQVPERVILHFHPKTVAKDIHSANMAKAKEAANIRKLDAEAQHGVLSGASGRATNNTLIDDELNALTSAHPDGVKNLDELRLLDESSDLHEAKLTVERLMSKPETLAVLHELKAQGNTETLKAMDDILKSALGESHLTYKVYQSITGTTTYLTQDAQQLIGAIPKGLSKQTRNELRMAISSGDPARVQDVLKDIKPDSLSSAGQKALKDIENAYAPVPVP